MPPASPSSSSIQHGRFLPGVMVAGRYRVVGMLGAGGMGEVYRADDLKLGQVVALKFLPLELQARPEVLERFLNEVRLARQVSHAGVCRVHDVGEFEGQTYLSMEYVDGEDLGSLLARIGRLAPDKATDIARQLCAALAAAHERGILHRDLKPANVMLDGRGRVRITDFGLATATDAGDERAGGTPAYMAPELFVGRGASVRSDLYSLGLTLYEVLTGAHPFACEELAELVRRQREVEPGPLHERAPEVDPAVERLVLQCLEKDPAARPGSVAALLAALPGTDPLQAALAAGETPSPELVASAAGAGALSARAAAALLALVLVGTLAVALMNRHVLLSERVPMDLAPEVLAHRAKELAERFGDAGLIRATSAGFGADEGALAWLCREDEKGREDEEGREGETGLERLASGAPGVVSYWWRSSPRAFITIRPKGRVRANDPPLHLEGMHLVQLRLDGRLLSFRRAPRRWTGAFDPRAAVDWAPLFEAAGLEPEDFEAVAPIATPRMASDARFAWRGVDPRAPDVELRVEAASYVGAAVAFEVLPSWHVPASLGGDPPASSGKLADVIRHTLFVVAFFGCAWAARRNMSRGRGDARGARRFAAYYLVLQMVAWLFGADHTLDLGTERILFFAQLMEALLLCAFFFVLYLALEPFVRRTWPRGIISWERLLAGRWRDPLVGRDVLKGFAFGTLLGVLLRGVWMATDAVAPGRSIPEGFDDEVLLGLRHGLARVVDDHVDGTISALVLLFLAVLSRALVRRPAVSHVVMTAVAYLLWPGRPSTGTWWLDLVVFAPVLALFLTMLSHASLVSWAVAFSWMTLVLSFPLSLDFERWYAGETWLLLLVPGLVAAAAWREATQAAPGPAPGT